MKYIALLRGINVGGHSAVSMSELKVALSDVGFENVSTYINSGNVLFESDERDESKIVRKIEQVLEENFFAIKTVVLSYADLKRVLEHVPDNWGKEDIRKYIAFVKSPSTPDDVLRDAQPREGVDYLSKGPGVVYMTTKLAGITKSGLTKLSTKAVYKDLTIRNFNTIEKLDSLLNRKDS